MNNVTLIGVVILTFLLLGCDSKSNKIIDACDRNLMYKNFPKEQADEICAEINNAVANRKNLYNACQKGDNMACNQYNFEMNELRRRLDYNMMRNQQWENSRKW